MQIEYAAPQPVRDAIEALGRTEDLRLSPDNRRLAVAGFARDRIALLEIEFDASAAGVQVTLSGALELSSPALKEPHGLDFIDDETLIVANRAGDVAVFSLPAAEFGVRSLPVRPLQTWQAGELNLLRSPGSVAVLPGGGDRREVLVCNNYIHTVTRHRLDPHVAHAPLDGDVLLRKWLNVPDGVTVSHDGRWIAVSNHNTHSVLVYDYSASLDEDSDPVAVLLGLHYPHGLRFTADDRGLFVADAGAPSVQFYARNGDCWSGVLHPESTMSVLGEAVFSRGHINPQEGGPKGLDITLDSDILMTTTEFQALAFFDVAAVVAVGEQRDARPVGTGNQPASPQDLTGMSDVGTQLRLMELEARAEAAEATLRDVTTGMSWRVTAPLRQLGSMLRKLH